MRERKHFPFSNRFWSELKTASNRLLMIDYDGTIAPFKKNRALAYPYPGIIELLRKIQKLPRNQIAIISGRSLVELKNFIQMDGIHLFGSYGLEEEENGLEKSWRLPEEERRILDRGREEIEAAGLKAQLEEKPFSLAFHVRGEKDADTLLKTALDFWKPLEKPNLISIIPFNGGIELTAGRTKDAAIGKLLECAPLNTFAVYIGDDFPDEPAFKAVNQCGWGIKIGPGKKSTCAKLFLKNFPEFISFLQRWVVCQKNGKDKGGGIIPQGI